MADIDYKPCHYCNTDLMLTVCSSFKADIGTDKVYWVHCSNCGSRGPLADSRLGAVAAYNDRPIELSLRADIQALLQKLQSK